MCPPDDAPERALRDDERKAARRVAAHTGADVRTVHRWARGESVTDLVDFALRAACRELHITTLPLGKQAPSETTDASAAQGAA